MGEDYVVASPSPLRKIIAARMTEVKQAVPHFRLVADVEVDALLDVLAELRKRRPDAGLSLNDLLVKAAASALMDEPAVNIQWVDGRIHQYRAADVSVVTAIPGGLATPIVRRAQSKSIWDISKEVKSLVARAAAGALKMDEVLGGTFSISNLGMYGVDQFDAIINSPQCAILAVGCAKPRMVVSPDRQARVATVLRITLSVDHRALDGASAAAFLSMLRRRLEEPQYLLDENN